jgi:hypothetical protein
MDLECREAPGKYCLRFTPFGGPDWFKGARGIKLNPRKNNSVKIRIRVVVAAAAMSATLTGCGDPAPPPPATSPDQVISQVADALKQGSSTEEVVYNKFDPGGINYAIGYRMRDTTDSGVRLSAELAVRDVLTVLKGSTVLVRNLAVVAMYPVTDEYGKTTLQPVVALGYTQDTISKIQLDSISSDNLLKVADTQVIHPGY